MLSAVGEGVQAFWQDGMLLDYTIEVEDEQIKVHKVIMASVSDYFKAMLTGGMVESQTDRVRLEGQNALAVSTMVKFIYTGQFGTTEVSAEELLACAMYLQVQPAIDVCCELLCNKVNAKNCIDILETFKAYGLEEGIEQTVSYIRSDMDEVLNVCKFDEMSQDKLGILLDCWGKSEWKLFLTIKEWINVDSQNRKQHLNDLMSRIRFALMTPKQVETIKDMDIYSESDGSWCDLVAEAEEYHNLPVRLKVLDVSEQSKVRADPEPLCFIKESDGVFHAMEGTAWIEHKAINHPKSLFGECTFIEVNNFLIACKKQEWYVFDPRTKRWSSMTTMPVPKYRFHPIHYNKQLYIVGGKVQQNSKEFASTDSMERYNLETNNWSVIPSKMPVVLEDFSACVLDGSIYVIGGWQKTPGEISRDTKFSIRMDCFDPSTNTWSSKAPIVDFLNDYRVQVIELCKEEVIVIMTYGFFMQYYSPSTDQWSVYDPLVGDTTTMVYHNRCAVLPSRNRLFLINFSYSEYEYVPGHHRLDVDDTTPGGCEVWTMREKGKKPIMKKLDDFPVYEDEDDHNIDYFLTLLAMAPQ